MTASEKPADGPLPPGPGPAAGPSRRSVIGVTAIGMVIVLSGMWMGRVCWCTVGDLWPWTWDIWNRHCSQHLIDPYTLSHLEHGIGTVFAADH